MVTENQNYNELFEDQGQLGAIYVLHLVAGVGLFLLIFLTGWLALDYFWASLVTGIVALLYVLKRMLNISMAKNAYDEMMKEARDDAEELGLDPEQTQRVTKDSLNAFARMEASKE